MCFFFPIYGHKNGERHGTPYSMSCPLMIKVFSALCLIGIYHEWGLNQLISGFNRI